MRSIDSRALKWACSAGTVLLLLALAPRLVRAQALSTSLTTSSNGLMVSCHWWVPNGAQGGYYPVQVDVSNAFGARQIRIAIETMTYPGDVVASRTVDLAGKSRSQFTISVPITNGYGGTLLRVYERGQELDKLLTGLSGVSGSLTRAHSLLVSPVPRDISALTTAAVQTVTTAGWTSEPPVILAPDVLPTKWIDYSTLDLVLISLKDLEQLPASRREPLLTWAFTGGNLLIYGLGEAGPTSPALDRLLDLGRRLPHGAAWRMPKPEDRNLGGGAVVQKPIMGSAGPARGMMPAPFQTVITRPLSKAAQSKPFFQVRPFGLGQLVAVSTIDPFPGSPADWFWVIKTIGSDRLTWSERYGMTVRGPNADFWNFLIPGVGRAPIVTFQVLITIFALVIGPLNYLALRRRKRLYLLLLTIPSLALLTTATLLGYALASDGFGVRTRARSVTLLDQGRGEAVSWTRISYYAGLAPSEGLHFSPETAVLPIEAEWRSTTHRVLDWTEDQHLESGWLRSRTPTQFLTVAYRQTDEGLAVSRSSAGTITVNNGLGARIRLLLLADERGGLHFGESLDQGGPVRLASATLATVLPRVQKLLHAQVLKKPSELDDLEHSSGMFGHRYYYGMANDSATTDSSLLENVIKQAADHAPGLGSMLRPRSYLALVERPPQIDLGISQTLDAGSLYVIWGAY